MNLKVVLCLAEAERLDTRLNDLLCIVAVMCLIGGGEAAAADFLDTVCITGQASSM